MSDELGPVEAQISEWVREHVVGYKFTCTHLILRHTNLDKVPDGDVTRVAVPNDHGLIGEVEMIVGKVATAAQQDADGIGGTIQQYCLYAYYKEEPTFVPRKYFRVSPDASYSQDDGRTEPPTERGLAAQAMRHLEAMTKINVGTQASMYGMLNRTITDQRAQLDAFMRQQTDLFLLVQETLNDGHARRLAERKEEANLAARESMFDYAKIALPVLINRLAGKAVLPERERSFMLIASLLESLTPEQQDFFKTSLTPQQLTIFAEVLGEYEKQKAEHGEKAMAAQLPGADADAPADDRKLAEVPRTPRMFSGLREQLARDDGSSDPVIQKMEKIGKNFGSRLKDALDPDKKGS